VVDVTSPTSDSEWESLNLPREDDILSSPSPTVDYFSHITPVTTGILLKSVIS
jgi:hypothetical protein